MYTCNNPTCACHNLAAYNLTRDDWERFMASMQTGYDLAQRLYDAVNRRPMTTRMERDVLEAVERANAAR